ncbi:MAG: class C sortase [Faecousia sp.]
MRRHMSTIILILVFLTGLSLLLYPSISDYSNATHQTRVITQYAEQMKNLDSNVYQQLWADARSYNQTLPGKGSRFQMTDEERAEYNALLNLSGNGMMGIIEIPTIRCTLPIYHGTEETVLQSAVGHVEGSSLPTGGAGTHCVLSGHRGLPSARLFTDLNKLVEGDIFIMQILDETLTYEVDQILIVDPYRIDSLNIEEGMDYCTLVTCTPYGVNTHRLLVRGHRIENQAETDVRITAEALQLEPVVVAPLVAAPMLLILLVLLLLKTPRKNRRD